MGCRNEFDDQHYPDTNLGSVDDKIATHIFQYSSAQKTPGSCLVVDLIAGVIFDVGLSGAASAGGPRKFPSIRR